MWLILAIISALSAGAVSVTVKAGLKDINTNVGTFLRTVFVLIFTLVMALITDSLFAITKVTLKEWLFVLASSLCTGFSWLCYFKALKLGDVNKVVPVDKMSTVLTMLLAIIILKEPFWWLTFAAMAIMTAGTFLMIGRQKTSTVTEAAGTPHNGQKTFFGRLTWFPLALLSLVFASLTSILAKIGMQNMPSNLGTFLRTAVVLVMAFLIVLGQRKLPEIGKLTKTNWAFLIVSGVLTGISWLCYYAAIQQGSVSVVAPIDKLSILASVIFSYIFFKEKLNLKSVTGLILLVAGTLLLLIKIPL